MPTVQGTHGNIVNYEVLGIAEAIQKLASIGQQVKDGIDAGTLKASNGVQEEVKESIAGNRSEPKSVDTGNFLNSIQLIKIADGMYEVSTRVEYAKILEYGGIGREPRSHFRNTQARMQENVKETVTLAVKEAVERT